VPVVVFSLTRIVGNAASMLVIDRVGRVRLLVFGGAVTGALSLGLAATYTALGVRLAREPAAPLPRGVEALIWLLSVARSVVHFLALDAAVWVTVLESHSLLTRPAGAALLVAAPLTFGALSSVARIGLMTLACAVGTNVGVEAGANLVSAVWTLAAAAAVALLMPETSLLAVEASSRSFQAHWWWRRYNVAPLRAGDVDAGGGGGGGGDGPGVDGDIGGGDGGGGTRDRDENPKPKPPPLARGYVTARQIV
jgi:hypothetical protein